jgi:crotonobetainyl-CoA:carnitine CoA-transferase CaiB-like acyl-CoA transferase
VTDAAQAFAFAESLDLEPVDETEGVRTVRSPIRLDRTPVRVRRRPPRLDEHGDEIRAWLRS